jgi:hypothetical protein
MGGIEKKVHLGNRQRRGQAPPPFHAINEPGRILGAQAFRDEKLHQALETGKLTGRGIRCKPALGAIREKGLKVLTRTGKKRCAICGKEGGHLPQIGGVG